MAIITISRGTFSGGKALAERIAERLGYPCLSREEVLAATTKEYGISEAEMTTAMNKPPPFWQQVPAKRLAYLKCVTAVLMERAKEGRLVYHGHAGHILLSGISHLIRIRLIADMAYRVEAAMERMGLDHDAAVSYIEKIDKERQKWTRFLYGVNWEDPQLYDAVFNLEQMNVSGICDLIVRMTELGVFKVTDQSKQVFEDLSLSSKVWAALAKDKRTRAVAIDIVSRNGQVTVSGSVGSEKTIEAITQLAKKVQGVTNVRNELGVGADWYW
ncbi:MAG: cytidylate kinase family protein [Deltaproteobacteria bacterium]|nr:cytidylate kinase family protein [Deltaproteobacteria bacterium]